MTKHSKFHKYDRLFRPIDRHMSGEIPVGRPINIYCLKCGEKTAEGKKYCSAHIEHQPYVKILMSRLAQFEEDRKLLISLEENEIDVPAFYRDGSIFSEIIEYLREHGTKTIERIALSVHENLFLVRKCIKAMERYGLIETAKNKRGNTVAFVNYSNEAGDD